MACSVGRTNHENDPEGLGAYALPLPAKSKAPVWTVKVSTLREVVNNKFHGGRLKMNIFGSASYTRGCSILFNSRFMHLTFPTIKTVRRITRTRRESPVIAVNAKLSSMSSTSSFLKLGSKIRT